MKPYFIYLFYYFLIYLFNIIQHNITINFTITGRKKGGKTVKKKPDKQARKSNIRKLNRLTTTGRTNRKIIIARVC